MRILPRDETFFDLLVSQAKNVLEASRLLESGLTGSAGKTEFSATAQQLRDLERKGDAQLRAILYRLHKTFITPIDPEDVHQLASRIDEILDHLDAESRDLLDFVEEMQKGLYINDQFYDFEEWYPWMKEHEERPKFHIPEQINLL